MTRAVASAQSPIHAVRDRILMAALWLDMYPPIDSYELRAMRERLWVNASMGARA